MEPKFELEFVEVVGTVEKLGMLLDVFVLRLLLVLWVFVLVLFWGAVKLKVGGAFCVVVTIFVVENPNGSVFYITGAWTGTGAGAGAWDQGHPELLFVLLLTTGAELLLLLFMNKRFCDCPLVLLLTWDVVGAEVNPVKSVNRLSF